MRDAQRQAATDVASRLFQEARDALGRGQVDSAAAKLRESAERAPHFKTYELLGECLLTQGHLEEAALFLSAGAGLGNRQGRPRYLLARALLQLDEPVLAAEKLREVIEMQPEYRAAHTLLATLSADPRVIAHFGLDESIDHVVPDGTREPR